ncbi:hypothetical protein KM043_017083 [Ampulex compressa]|nr:hypothetical protein KM043_017083 [Ampulex compressa]
MTFEVKATSELRDTEKRKKDNLSCSGEGGDMAFARSKSTVQSLGRGDEWMKRLKIWKREIAKELRDMIKAVKEEIRDTQRTFRDCHQRAVEVPRERFVDAANGRQQYSKNVSSPPSTGGSITGRVNIQELLK